MDNDNSPFTPLEKATDFNRRSLSLKVDGGLRPEADTPQVEKPSSTQTGRGRSSLTGFTYRRGIVLAVVMGVVLIISTLALVALYLGTSESRNAERKIRRMRAFYAGQGMMVHALEELRSGTDPSGSFVWGTGNLQVDVNYTDDDSGPGGTDPVTITVHY